ncbi:DUF424 domain-containing protein [Halomarina rubra]|uniref:DUF424 family protein n=1 Tax=Halomarina rubra TaxID=2071873 RepID=A0ABD6AVS3_9EURY|nr:DUF424 domain-containing protein [Halomarina rubra]
MLLTERETNEGLLVSVCDRDVLGETFEAGEFSLTVEEEFYAEDAAEADEEAVAGALARAAVANIVGREAVEVAVEHGFVDESTVLDLGETRHAQLLRL